MTVTSPRRPLDVAEISWPEVTPRVDWGADESLRYDSTGREIWPPSFHPIQKVIVHHTATYNDDPDPTRTVRAIYRYHAVDRGWGDIGYNFLIDGAGTVYEGRHAFEYSSGASRALHSRGYGVAGAHAQYNSGTVGLALLGTLAVREHTGRPQCRRGARRRDRRAERDRPLTRAPTRTRSTGMPAMFPNVAAHRDVAETDCPGSALYEALPGIREQVTTLIAARRQAFRAPR